MTDPSDAARSEILARLAESRAELCRLLEPQRQESEEGGPAPSGTPDGFPRSWTMRKLMSGPGLGTVGAVAAGLLVARPVLALRLLRMLPVSAVARALMLRVFTGLRAKHE